MCKYFVYKTTNLLNGRFYIGKSSKVNSNYLGSGKLITKAIKKYGVDNFRREILENCDLLEELEKAELFHLNNNLDCFVPKGYNILHGSNGGDTLTNHPDIEIIKRKMRLARIGKCEGEKNPMYNRKHKPESIKKMSEIKKNISYEERYGKDKSDEIKRKFSKTTLGKKVGPRPNIMGDKNPSKRKEVLKKISEKKREMDKNKIACEFCKKNFTKPNYIKHRNTCEKNQRSIKEIPNGQGSRKETD